MRAENLQQNPNGTGSLQADVQKLAPWFHNLHLPDGTQTVPDSTYGDFPTNKWRKICDDVPENLKGWTCLDVGCNAGFYSFELARRGASVLGIDVDPHYLNQARWAAKQYELNSQVEFRQMQVYDLAHTTQQFDLVLFMGVFYHLRYPLLGLDIIAQKVRRLMVFQTLTMPGLEVIEQPEALDINYREPMRLPGFPKMSFIEHEFAGDPTNWWAPNHAGVLAMLRSSGMKLIRPLGHEIYLCEPDTQRPACVTTWNAAEYLSATGQLNR